MDVRGVIVFAVCTVGYIVEGDLWLSNDSVFRLSMGAEPRAGWWFCKEAISASASILGVEDSREGGASLEAVSFKEPINGLCPGDARACAGCAVRVCGDRVAGGRVD